MTSVAKRMAPRTSDEAAEDDLERGPPLALGLAVVLAQPAEDVLDVDDRVVDERADARS